MSLSWKVKGGYSVGHVLNDLCAAMWFSYLLVYFHQILRLSATAAGYLLLVGQITDGLATPIVGVDSDNFGLFGEKYGRRKSWHACGSISVVCSFIFIFTAPPQYIPDVTPEFVPMVYYVPFIVVFQIGWASTQVSHLSIIPNLTPKECERTKLNSYRYGCTVLSSVLVYAIAFGLLKSSSESHLGYHDSIIFSRLAIIVVVLGLLFVITFHLSVPEEKVPLNRSTGEPTLEISTEINDPTITRWQQWFHELNFYITGFIYMLSRLTVNVSQVYMPFYLTDTLKEHKAMIAVVPLIGYISGFIASLVASPILQRTNNHVLYCSGSFLVFISCGWMFGISESISDIENSKTNYQIIGIAIFNGFGTAAVLVSSLALTSALIGSNTCTAAFVYGAMSLTDKIANGATIMAVQYMNPCGCDCELCGLYFRNVMVFAVGGFTIAANITVIFHYFWRRNMSVHYENI